MKIYQIHYSASKHKQKLRLTADTPQSLGFTERKKGLMSVITKDCGVSAANLSLSVMYLKSFHPKYKRIKKELKIIYYSKRIYAIFPKILENYQFF
jgi:hypothetical protein